MKFRGKEYENRNLYPRGRVYWVTFTGRDGKRKFVSTETDDIVKAREIRDAYLSGKGPSGNPSELILTVEKAINLYLSEREELGEKIPEKKKRSLHDDRRVLGRFQNYIGKDRDIKTLDDSDFDGFEIWLIDNFPKAKSVHRRNRHFKILNLFFNRCVRKRRMKFNPVLPFLDELQSEDKRERYATVSEYVKLLAACSAPANGFNPLLRPIVETLTITGLRLGDVLSLAWDNVDFEAGEIRIVQMKTRKRHIVPVGERLRNILATTQQHLDSPYIFNVAGKRITQNGWLRGQFQKAVAAAGIKDFHFHDLRRTAMTHSGGNASLDAIQKTFGHATPAMTERYMIPITENKRKVQDLLTSLLYGASVTKKVTLAPSVAPSQIGAPAKTDGDEGETTDAGVAEWQTRQTQNLVVPPTENPSPDDKPSEPT